jgi:CO/xanthine dehydrogenase FAD-binding subunit
MEHFFRLSCLEDVLEMLWAEGPVCLLVAGGTDLLVRPQRLAEKKIGLDVSQLPELLGIGLDEEGRIRIGASMTIQEIADHPLIQRRLHLLALACSAIGSFQIRNRGTLGGNLGNGSPAGDSIPALACLNSKVVVAARVRRREVDVCEFLKGPGKTECGQDEVIESVRVSIPDGRTAAFFKKAGQRRGMCCSKASVAFMAKSEGDGRLVNVRISLGAVAPTILRVPLAENVLENHRLNREVIAEAAKACTNAALPVDDIRSSKEYRRHVVGALLQEGLFEIMDHQNALQKHRKKRRRL